MNLNKLIGKFVFDSFYHFFLSSIVAKFLHWVTLYTFRIVLDFYLFLFL